MSIIADVRFKAVAKALFEGLSAVEASRAAGYDEKGTSFEANARKRAAHPQVRAYLAEMQKRAAALAEIDRGYVLVNLKQAAEFNLADYLEFDRLGKPEVVLKGRSRELMGRLGEAAFEPSKYGLKTRIKGDKLAALTLIARIIGADKDPVADALTGIGERLDKAFARASAAE